MAITLNGNPGTTQIEVAGSITELIARSMIAPASTCKGTGEGNVIPRWGAVTGCYEDVRGCIPNAFPSVHVTCHNPGQLFFFNIILFFVF